LSGLAVGRVEIFGLRRAACGQFNPALAEMECGDLLVEMLGRRRAAATPNSSRKAVSPGEMDEVTALSRRLHRLNNAIHLAHIVVERVRCICGASLITRHNHCTTDRNHLIIFH
jgi:hypothetical protein